MYKGIQKNQARQKGKSSTQATKTDSNLEEQD